MAELTRRLVSIFLNIVLSYRSLINMCYIPLERGENFLQFDIKFTFEYVFIKSVLEALKRF